METTKALWDSSYQLRAIGWNLNQIAKRLNEGKPANIKVEQMEKLATYIYHHTEKVAAVQDASLSRWLISTPESFIEKQRTEIKETHSPLSHPKNPKYTTRKPNA